MRNAKATSYFVLTAICFCLFSGFCSFPAYAGNTSFSFFEFNIAFVLGLSLPTLVTAFLISRANGLSAYSPVLLTVALLALLFSMVYIPVRNDAIALTFSALILQLSFYWFAEFQAATIKNTEINKHAWQRSAYAFLLVVFLVVLWLGIIDAATAWLAFSFLQILFFVIQPDFIKRIVSKSKQGFLPLLSANIVFAIAVYIWVSSQLSLEVLAMIVVTSYVASMVVGCWLLIFSTKTIEISRNNTSQEPENISLDPATNLPSYQSALSRFNFKAKHQSSARYAAITFKPTNFQQVNAVLGHHNSDILLLQLAYCLQKAVELDHELLNFSAEKRPVRIARLQGLHFLVVIDVSLSKHDDEIIIEQLCKKLANAVPGPMSFKSFSLFFKLVFGVAFVGKDSSNVSEVIACAEDALLQADKQQKLMCFFAQELAVFNQQQLQKMEHLKRDILSDAIAWQVQPQIKLASKNLLAFELLLSWQHQTDKKLNFNEVMLLAQQSGDAFILCQKMISQAFIFLKLLHSNHTPVPVALKVSHHCLLEPDLIDYIEQQAIQHNIDCQYLVLEIQEEVLLTTAQAAKASIEQLKSLGVKVAIDEFSGSYEALRYLRRLAVSEIKINCQALAQAEAGSSDKAIINALINLTRKMDLPLVGTNINSTAIEDMFVSMGGEYAQGNHYSAGVSLNELSAWLKSWYQQYPSQTH